MGAWHQEHATLYRNKSIILHYIVILHKNIKILLASKYSIYVYLPCQETTLVALPALIYLALIILKHGKLE